MYIRNTSKNASEIFLETEAERQHFENIRKQIRSLEAEAGRVVCAQAAIELESYARQLADSNKKIAEYQKEYDRLSWLGKFLTIAPDPEAQQTNSRVYVWWSWIPAIRPAAPNFDLSPGSLGQALLPAVLPFWEYRLLEQYTKNSDLTPFIELNHTPHQENLHFFGCPSSTEVKCPELPKELEMDTLYCVTVKPLA